MFAMSSLSRLLFVLISAAMSPSFVQSVQAEPAVLEKLLAVKFTKMGVTLTVWTGGCTKKSDFEIMSRRLKKRVVSIEVRRLAPDVCKGNFPDGVKLLFSWSELRAPNRTKILLRNPIVHSGKLTTTFDPNSVRTVSTRTWRLVA